MEIKITTGSQILMKPCTFGQYQYQCRIKHNLLADCQLIDLTWACECLVRLNLFLTIHCMDCKSTNTSLFVHLMIPWGLMDRQWQQYFVFYNRKLAFEIFSDQFYFLFDNFSSCCRVIICGVSHVRRDRSILFTGFRSSSHKFVDKCVHFFWKLVMGTVACEKQ